MPRRTGARASVRLIPDPGTSPAGSAKVTRVNASLLGDTSLRVSRLGLGLAAVARPGYITLGRARDLPGARTPEALYERCAALLDAAIAFDIRYLDVARSYGRAEEFLARWLKSRDIPRDDVTIGSKWGYQYTAGWAIDAEVHEQKELSLGRFRRQLDESRSILGDRIGLYQIHSATLESGVLDDGALMAALVAARRDRAVGAIGLTLSGAGSARTLARAMQVRSDGVRVFDVVQATCNILEPSLAPLLRDAHQAGMGVIVKEVHANGRLTPANRLTDDAAVIRRLTALAAELGISLDQLALAFVLDMPFVDVVNSGAATLEHLRSHISAPTTLDANVSHELARVAQDPESYWSHRSALPWN